MYYVWLIVALLGILAAAELFTNAIEWVGYRFKLGGGGVGSVLAAVGTALPETMIPLMALTTGLLSGDEEIMAKNSEIGIGAILGAPFMLGCVAFAVAGFAKMIFHRTGRRERHINLNRVIFRRDMGAFVLLYSLAIICSFFPEHWMKVASSAVLFLGYIYYVYLTFKGDTPDLEMPKPCFFDRKCEVPRDSRIWGQLATSLVMLIGLAYVFVEEVKNISELLNVNPLMLALIIAPLATELPEKFNSIIWMRESKDTLALGNIAGAMVFQSTFPVSVGILMTDWVLWKPGDPDSWYALLPAIFALVAGIYFYLLNLFGVRIRSRLLAVPFVLYVAYIIFVIVKS